MTEVTSPNTTETDPIAEPAPAETSILPASSKKLFILSAIIITILRIAEPMDRAMTNTLSAMVAILTFALYFAWLLFRSHLSIATRKRIGLTSCIILAIAASMFKITAVDGFLIPTIRLRWSAAPDQSLTLSLIHI